VHRLTDVFRKETQCWRRLRGLGSAAIVVSLITSSCSSASNNSSVAGSDKVASEQPQRPALPTIAAGFDFACARTSTAGVACWGADESLQLGTAVPATNDIEINSSRVPILVAGVTNVETLAAGNSHACAVLRDRTMKCWGQYVDENTGTTLSIAESTSTPNGHPTIVDGIDNAVAVSAGRNFTCVLTTSETVKCWGTNDSGQLGSGPGPDSGVPQLVKDLSEVVQIASGERHSCALKRTGTVMCWGDPQVLGDGKGKDQKRNLTGPTEVEGLADARSISVNAAHSCALRETGSVVCWGGLGDDETGISDVPVKIKSIDDAQQITTGGEFSCAVRRDQRLWCWGSFSGLLTVGVTKAFAGRKENIGISYKTDHAVSSQMASGHAFLCQPIENSRVFCLGSDLAAVTGQDGFVTLPS
jgi:alpha-tubulin suppressor-like RCC1 family protein